MKMQPKKLRSFAVSTSKNKKFLSVAFIPEQACFDLSFLARAALLF